MFDAVDYVFIALAVVAAVILIASALGCFARKHKIGDGSLPAVDSALPMPPVKAPKSVYADYGYQQEGARVVDHRQCCCHCKFKGEDNV